MTRAISAFFWVAAYLLVVLSPLFLMLVRPIPSGRSFWLELSIALGFVGLVQIGLQFVLIARFKRVTSPYGIDVILQYHKQIAMVAVTLVLLHPVILMIVQPSRLVLLNPFGGNWASRFALLSVVSLLLVVGLSVYRQRLKLGYETWRVSHALLSIAALVFAQLHISLAGLYVNTWWKQALWIAFSGAMVAVLAYLRLVKPALQRRHPYRVAEVRAEQGDTYTLALTPDGHKGLAFEPGQFAWIKLANPYTVDEHPYSFSSSALRPDRLEFGIKVLGDFSSTVKDIPKGTVAYLDGPHGSFSVDHYPAPGYVFYAGGIGVTPIMSTLKTLADRDDKRPLQLFYAAKSWDDFAFLDEIRVLKEQLDLTVLLVPQEPPEGWQGASGFIDGDLLAEHLQEGHGWVHFICGPAVMMDAVNGALRKRGVPEENTQMEQFSLV